MRNKINQGEKNGRMAEKERKGGGVEAGLITEHFLQPQGQIRSLRQDLISFSVFNLHQGMGDFFCCCC